MNWFQRHLNWTWVFAYLIWISMNASNDIVPQIMGDIFLLVVSGWVIKQKGRSLWWILLTIIFSPLWLKNKRLVNQSLPAIKDEERQECLAYYEEEKKLRLLYERVEQLFNKSLGRYEDAYFQARKARSEFWSSMDKIFEVREYMSHAATEIVNRKKAMRSAPSPDSAMSSAYEAAYLDYEALRDPSNIAAGSDPVEVEIRRQREKELLTKFHKSKHKAEKEEREFLKRLKLSNTEAQRITDNASRAIATDEWLRKLEMECP